MSSYLTITLGCHTVSEGQGLSHPALYNLFLEALGMVNAHYLLVQTAAQGGRTVTKQETGAGCPPPARTHSPAPTEGWVQSWP